MFASGHDFFACNKGQEAQRLYLRKIEDMRVEKLLEKFDQSQLNAHFRD